MFEQYKSRVKKQGESLSEILRFQSDAVVNATWSQSVSCRPVMVKHIDSGLPEFNEYRDEVFEAHFEQKSKYHITGDEVTYWLRFRPHILKCHPEIRIGSYVSIPDSDGKREIWLIVHIDDDNEQKWLQVLKCNWIYKWIYKGKLYQALGCQRYASSYNSGVFFADRTTSVENMNGFWLPTNHDSDTIGYDQRFLINDGNREVPITWSITKIETTIPIGLTKFTVSQVSYDPIHDNRELGIANYFDSELPIETGETAPDTIEFPIIYNGTKPQIKVGGSVKTFTAQIPEESLFDIMWSIIDGDQIYSSGTYDNGTNIYGDYTVITTDRTLSLKIAKNYELVGKILKIKAHLANGSEGEVQIEVIA